MVRGHVSEILSIYANIYIVLIIHANIHIFFFLIDGFKLTMSDAWWVRGALTVWWCAGRDPTTFWDFHLAQRQFHNTSLLHDQCNSKHTLSTLWAHSEHIFDINNMQSISLIDDRSNARKGLFINLILVSGLPNNQRDDISTHGKGRRHYEIDETCKQSFKWVYSRRHFWILFFSICNWEEPSHPL